MTNRQEAVLSLVKFNRFFKQLTYDVTLGGSIKLTSYVDELLNFEQWAENILGYVKFNPDPIILDQITTLGSPQLLTDYKEEGKEIMPSNTYDALSKVINAVNALNGFVEDFNQKAKGKYSDLVDEFAYEDAARLFDRAVSAGYLTTDYQPKGDTDVYTLKVIAFAIGEMLHLTMRHKWSHFEEMWHIDYVNKFSSLPISERQFKRAEKLMKLYPEVDFSALMKPKDDVFFEPTYGSGRVRDLYKSLRNGGYISKETKVDDFMSIFNLSKSRTRKPIEWMGDQRHLTYFIFQTFSKTNRDYWIKAQACFTIKGKTPHKASMVSGLHALQLRPDYDTYDLQLKRIASQYNNG